MNKKLIKLRLSRQTIRTLSEAQTGDAVGAATGYCSPPYGICIPPPTEGCPPPPPPPASFQPPYDCWP